MTGSSYDAMMSTMKPLVKPEHQTTIHKDGTVSFWCIYNKIWMRLKMHEIPTKNLASFSSKDRMNIVEKLLKTKNN